MKKYLENRIEIFEKGKAKAKETILSFKVGSYARNYYYNKANKYAFALSETKQHLNYLLSQNETQNISDNECENEYCDCAAPHADSDNECCRICNRLLDFDD